MGVRFFGQYLVDEGLITPEQLLDALAATDSTRLGSLAVRKGLITPGALDSLQAKFGHDYVHLGEEAVKVGLLTEQQLDYLQRLQKSDVRQLGLTLQKRGACSGEELEQAVEGFRSAQRRYAVEPRKLPPQAVGRHDMVALLGMSEALFLEVGRIPARLDAVQPYSGPPYTQQYAVGIALGGDFTGRYILSPTADIAGQLVRSMLNMDAADVALEYIVDALGEFCNSVVGAAAGALASMGQELTFGPPHPIAHDAPPIASGIVCVATSLHGRADILIG